MTDDMTPRTVSADRTALSKRLDDIRFQARRTFGEDFGDRWLMTSSRYFNGTAPIAFAKDEAGAERVLEHIGYFSKARL